MEFLDVLIDDVIDRRLRSGASRATVHCPLPSSNESTTSAHRRQPRSQRLLGCPGPSGDRVHQTEIDEQRAMGRRGWILLGSRREYNSWLVLSFGPAECGKRKASESESCVRARSNA